MALGYVLVFLGTFLVTGGFISSSNPFDNRDYRFGVINLLSGIILAIIGGIILSWAT